MLVLPLFGNGLARLYRFVFIVCGHTLAKTAAARFKSQVPSSIQPLDEHFELPSVLRGTRQPFAFDIAGFTRC